MKRAVLTSVLVLSLAGCGGSRDEAAAPAAPEPSTSSAAAGPSSTGAPSAEPSAQECPLQATTVEAPAGASTDLTQKPVVPASTAPPPAEVTVADVVVGTGDEATTGSRVQAKYVGAFYESGEEFDSSWSRGPDETIPFQVCSSGVIPGFAVAPEGMKVGGRRIVTIPAEYGYGEQGSPPTIPPNTPLVFVIDLVEVSAPTG